MCSEGPLPAVLAFRACIHAWLLRCAGSSCGRWCWRPAKRCAAQPPAPARQQRMQHGRHMRRHRAVPGAVPGAAEQLGRGVGPRRWRRRGWCWPRGVASVLVATAPRSPRRPKGRMAVHDAASIQSIAPMSLALLKICRCSFHIMMTQDAYCHSNAADLHLALPGCMHVRVMPCLCQRQSKGITAVAGAARKPCMLLHHSSTAWLPGLA